MTKPQRRATITREHLLGSALDIIQNQGINGFTLDRVAENAGVSKGGLLYHFPTKDDLIDGLLKRTFEHYDRLYQHYLQEEPPGKGRQLRAYIRASFDESQVSLELASLLRASTAEDPQLGSRFQQEIVRWRKRLVNDGVSRTWMRVIRRATDAYWIDHLLGIIEDSLEEREAFRDELVRLTHHQFSEDPQPIEGDLING